MATSGSVTVANDEAMPCLPSSPPVALYRWSTMACLVRTTPSSPRSDCFDWYAMEKRPSGDRATLEDCSSEEVLATKMLPSDAPLLEKRCARTSWFVGATST